MLYIKRSRLKTLLGGWVDGWVAGKAGLRIAYSNKKYVQKLLFSTEIYWILQECKIFIKKLGLITFIVYILVYLDPIFRKKIAFESLYL
jgi:hypothetical protein